MIRFILSFTLCAANPDEILSRVGQATAAALKSKATESARVAALAVVEAVVAAREPHETLNAIASEAEKLILGTIKFPEYLVTRAGLGIDVDASTVKRISSQSRMFRSDSLVAEWLRELDKFPGQEELIKSLSDREAMNDETRAISRIEEKLEFASRFFSKARNCAEADAMVSNVAAWRAQIAIVMKQEGSIVHMQKCRVISSSLLDLIREMQPFLLEQRRRLGLVTISSNPAEFARQLGKSWKADFSKIKKVYPCDDEASLVAVLSFSVAVATVTDPLGLSLSPVMRNAVSRWREGIDRAERELGSPMIHKRAEQIKTQRTVKEMEDAIASDTPPSIDQVDRWLVVLESMHATPQRQRLLESFKRFREHSRSELQLKTMQLTFIKAERFRENLRPRIQQARRALGLLDMSKERQTLTLAAAESGMVSISSPQLIAEWKRLLYSILFSDDEEGQERALIALTKLEDAETMDVIRESIESSANLKVKIESAVAFFGKREDYGLEMEAMIGHFFLWRSFLTFAMINGEEATLLGDRFDEVWALAESIPREVMMKQRHAMGLASVQDIASLEEGADRLEALKRFSEALSTDGLEAFSRKYCYTLLSNLVCGHSANLALEGLDEFADDPLVAKFLIENRRTLRVREKRIAIALHSGIDANTMLGYLPHYMQAIWHETPTSALIHPESEVTFSWPCLAIESPMEFVKYVDSRASVVLGNACRLGWISHLETIVTESTKRSEINAAEELMTMLKQTAAAEKMQTAILSLNDISIKLPIVLEILEFSPGVYNAEVEAAIGVLSTWFSLLAHMPESTILEGCTSTAGDFKFRIGSALDASKWAIDELHRKIGLKQIPIVHNAAVDEYAPYLHSFFCQLMDESILDKASSRFKGKGEAASVLLNTMLVVLPDVQDLNLSDDVQWKLGHSLKQISSTVNHLLAK